MTRGEISPPTLEEVASDIYEAVQCSSSRYEAEAEIVEKVKDFIAECVAMALTR